MPLCRLGLGPVARCVAVLVLTGCSRCEQQQTVVSNNASEDPAEASWAIEGRVVLKDGVELPSYPLKPAPDGCLDRASMMRPVQFGDRALRTLKGVHIAAVRPRGEFATEPTEHTIKIRDCLLTPSMILATRGDRLVAKNETDVEFVPALKKGSYLQTLMDGQFTDLDRGGIFPVTCPYGNPCGRVDVIVHYHPVFTVTGEDGRFRLEGLLDDGEVELSAWHPLFKEALLMARPGAEGSVEFVLEPVGEPSPGEAEPAPAEAEVNAD